MDVKRGRRRRRPTSDEFDDLNWSVTRSDQTSGLDVLGSIVLVANIKPIFRGAARVLAS